MRIAGAASCNVRLHVVCGVLVCGVLCVGVWRTGRHHNLLTWVRSDVVGGLISDPAAAQLVYTLLKICCFFVATVICARRGYFWKL